MSDTQQTPAELVNMEAAKRVTSFMDPAVWVQMKTMATVFKDAGALPKGLDSVPKILIVMQTGFENGLKPMEAITSLYIVSGAVNYYGKAVIRRLREHGWRVEYKDETVNTVTAIVTNVNNPKEFYTESYSFQEAEKSGYTVDSYGKLKFGWKEGLNRKLKLRYGVVSMIIKSYIPEVLGSAKGIVEVEEDAIIDQSDVSEPETRPTETPKPKTSMADFMKYSKDQDKKRETIKPSKPAEKVHEGELVEKPESKPVKPAEFQEAEVVPEVSPERTKLNKRYFALLKELQTDHATAKSLFQFEHLSDLSDQQLIDIVGQLSVNVGNSKGK